MFYSHREGSINIVDILFKNHINKQNEHLLFITQLTDPSRLRP